MRIGLGEEKKSNVGRKVRGSERRVALTLVGS